MVVKLQRAIVTESATLTGQTLLVIGKPGAKSASPLISYCPLALLTLPPAIDFAGNYFADLEGFVRLFSLT
jgi:hypothetical protein